MTQSLHAPRRFDLVVASYVIGEARSPSERRRLVDSLWRRTGGMLVLVEPGTPVGSANIREARAQACLVLLPPCADSAKHEEMGIETPSWSAVGWPAAGDPVARSRASIISEGASRS